MILMPKPAPMYISLVVAAMLQLIPLPDSFSDARPLWLPMTVLFWNITAPSWFNIGSSWLVGIFLDLLTGSLLGQHALAMVAMSYIAIRFYKQYRLYSVAQRLLLAGSALLVWQLIDNWIWRIDGQTPGATQIWLPLLTSLLLWPWYQGVLDWVNEHWRADIARE